MKRVDMWESVAAVAMFCAKPRTVRGARYSVGAFTVASGLDKLTRLAVKLKRLDEDMCNGTIGGTEAILNYSAAYSYQAKLEARVAKIGEELGVVIEHQGDPRGATIKVWADKVDGRLLACF